MIDADAGSVYLFSYSGAAYIVAWLVDDAAETIRSRVFLQQVRGRILRCEIDWKRRQTE
jgi:hypothetical protein